MTDREKVITGLQCIINGNVRCESCGYAIDKHGHYSCQQNCASDAISLLKEQETVVRCKDCIYADDFDCPAPLPTGYLCQKGHGSHLGHWFCADGKRKVSK